MSGRETGRDITIRRNADVATEWFAEVPKTAAKVALLGYGILLFGVVGFGAWAGTAPIDGAIVAPGVFVATGQNKIVQHLEGGIIERILVREGELVEDGQPLIRLDGTAANAELRRLKLREYQLVAQEFRLAAEERLALDLTFPAAFARTDLGADGEAILAAQQSTFTARMKKLHNEISILEQSIQSYRHREAGDAARLSATIEQMRLIDVEMSGKKGLHDRGLVRLPEYFAVRRAYENARGQVGQLESEIRDSRERVVATGHQIDRVRSIFVQSAVEERLAASSELKDIRERLIAANSVLNRLDVRAPVRGIVVKLNYHTPGGVIRPGVDILALLPLGDELLIEARIRPQDIDNLNQGHDAVVRLSALSQRVTPMVSGEVIYVSADAMPNDARGATDNAYVARVRLDPEQVRTIPGFVPTPGMPVEVYMKTGQRTFFHYLMQPLYDTMARAFRES